jgi:hypothetical protein
MPRRSAVQVIILLAAVTSACRTAVVGSTSRMPAHFEVGHCTRYCRIWFANFRT